MTIKKHLSLLAMLLLNLNIGAAKEDFFKGFLLGSELSASCAAHESRLVPAFPDPLYSVIGNSLLQACVVTIVCTQNPLRHPIRLNQTWDTFSGALCGSAAVNNTVFLNNYFRALDESSKYGQIRRTT